ncbi:MAG TPA: PDZ domain-containing protein, partial [Humisphaera sp.]
AAILAAAALAAPCVVAPGLAADAPPVVPPSPAAQPTAPATQPAPAAAAPNFPSLERLNAECLALHRSLDGSLLRVQMPTPRWYANAQRDNPIDRYRGKLTPEVQRALEQQQARRGGQQSYRQSEDAPPQAPPQAPGQAQQEQQPMQRSATPPPGPAQQTPAAQSQPGPANNFAGQFTLNGNTVVNNYAGAGAGNAGSAAVSGVADNGATANAGATNPGALTLNGNTATINVGGNPGVPNGTSQALTNNGLQLRNENGSTYIVPMQQAAEPLANAAANTAGGNFDNNLRFNRNVRFNDPAGNNDAANPAAQQAAAAAFAPNTVGLLLDDAGHVLVPIYLEREAAGDRPVRLAAGDGDVVDATFVGSDEQTGLTVLRLAKAPAATRPAAGPPPERPASPPRLAPARLNRDRLAEGSLVMLVNPADGSGRLAVWTGGAREFGVVVTVDGRVAGIARGGQFLSAAACRLVADHIVRHGAVRRATLGVVITQVEPTDPARQQVAELGDRAAVRVDEVVKGSAADRAGVRQGDLILALGGDPVHDIPSLAAAIAARSGEAKLTILRDGRTQDVTVQLVRQ